MPVFALRSSDFDERSRVEQFRGAVAAMCQLDIMPEDRGSFRSETVIGLLPDVVLGETVHSACVTERTTTLAAETGDSILFHIPLAGGFSIRQRGGEEFACEAGDIYVDPSEVPGVSRFLAAARHGPGSLHARSWLTPLVPWSPHFGSAQPKKASANRSILAAAA